MKSFEDMSVEELDAAKTARAQQIRAIEDEIDQIEAVMQDKLDSDAANREVERMMSSLSPAAREKVKSTLIKGVPADSSMAAHPRVGG